MILPNMSSPNIRWNGRAGEKLVDMLANLDLGLRPVTTYEIDSGFFKEFEG